MTSSENSNGNGDESLGSRLTAALSESGNERDTKFREAAQELQSEMEGTAAELKTLILAQPPADMLGYLLAQVLLAQIHGDKEDGELELQEARETITFLLEYAQAVASCFDAHASQTQSFDEAAAQKAIDVASKLRQSAISMASSELRDGEFGEATAEVEFKAKTSWIMIRGNRCQVLEEEFFRFVLKPHDEIFRRAYGFGANEVSSPRPLVHSRY